MQHFATHHKKKISLALLLFFFSKPFVFAQTLAGLTSFSFITQPNTSKLSALGGINITSIGDNIGMAFHNPALLRKDNQSQLDASFNSFFAGIKNYSLSTAFHSEKNDFNYSASINFINYGIIDQTDAAGNILGNFRATDFLVQIQASKQFYNRWFFGTTVKFINSQYGQFTSNAIATDIGLNYFDKDKNFQAGLVIKNVGTTLKSFTTNAFKEELPFDIQLGFTKKIEKAPFQISLTAHHLQALNPLYNDTIFNAEVGNSRKGFSTLEKIFSHLILANEIFIGDKMQATVSYNFLRRNDLNIYNTTNGLNGFNFGLSFTTKKLVVNYATGLYQQNMFHHFSFQINLRDKGL